MDSKTLEQIESKLAFLENANTELSDVVYRQQQELERLQLQMRRLTEEVRAQPGAERAPTPDEERPPHY